MQTTHDGNSQQVDAGRSFLALSLTGMTAAFALTFFLTCTFLTDSWTWLWWRRIRLCLLRTFFRLQTNE